MTGDLGWMDEQGYLRVVGRQKDIIIRGGHNIYPARIEALALRHTAVEKAAAFPVPDQRLGERVCLAVVARENMSVEPAGDPATPGCGGPVEIRHAGVHPPA